MFATCGRRAVSRVRYARDAATERARAREAASDGRDGEGGGRMRNWAGKRLVGAGRDRGARAVATRGRSMRDGDVLLAVRRANEGWIERRTTRSDAMVW